MAGRARRRAGPCGPAATRYLAGSPGSPRLGWRGARKEGVVRMSPTPQRDKAPGSRLQAPGSRLQAPGSRLQGPVPGTDANGGVMSASCASAEPEWGRLCWWLHRWASAGVPACWVDDAIGETMLALWQRFRAGSSVRAWTGLAVRELRTQVGRLRRAPELVALAADCDVEGVPTAEPFDDASEREPTACTVAEGLPLRGRLQREIVSRVLRGETCAVIASGTNRAEKEIRRVTSSIAERILKWRKTDPELPPRGPSVDASSADRDSSPRRRERPLRRPASPKSDHEPNPA
jgi:hypothetical protein